MAGVQKGGERASLSVGIVGGNASQRWNTPLPPTPFVRRARRLVTYSLPLLFPFVFLSRSCHQNGVIITPKRQVFLLAGFVFIIKPIRSCLCQVPKPLIIIIPRGQSVWGHVRQAKSQNDCFPPVRLGYVTEVNFTERDWENRAYKHNAHFIRKQDMSRARRESGPAHLIKTAHLQRRQQRHAA